MWTNAIMILISYQSRGAQTAQQVMAMMEDNNDEEQQTFWFYW
jgi:hypothetical protein